MRKLILHRRIKDTRPEGWRKWFCFENRGKIGWKLCLFGVSFITVNDNLFVINYGSPPS